MDDPTVPLALGASLALLALGLFGVVAREELLRVILGLEVMGKGVTLAFVTAGRATDRLGAAQAMVFTIVVIEVVVAAIALALLVRFHGATGRLDVRAMRRLVG